VRQPTAREPPALREVEPYVVIIQLLWIVVIVWQALGLPWGF
jgi:hypothetical protein